MISDKAKDIARAFSQILPERFDTVKEEIQSYLSLFLENSLATMSIVSRKDFDIQQQILSKTRQKLDMLEKKIALLEKELHRT